MPSDNFQPWTLVGPLWTRIFLLDTIHRFLPPPLIYVSGSTAGGARGAEDPWGSGQRVQEDPACGGHAALLVVFQGAFAEGSPTRPAQLPHAYPQRRVDYWPEVQCGPPRSTTWPVAFPQVHRAALLTCISDQSVHAPRSDIHRAFMMVGKSALTFGNSFQ